MCGHVRNYQETNRDRACVTRLRDVLGSQVENNGINFKIFRHLLTKATKENWTTGNL